MRVFTYSQARQQLADVMQYAQVEGSVCISRRDGRLFQLTPISAAPQTSPLAVKALNLNLSQAEIIQAVQEGRRDNS
jgi:antitoxin Phd